MIVRFTKARHADRPHTFTCIRDDGTATGMPSSEFFVRHDLTHFAVESVLGLREAFFGLLNSGWDIRSFEEREPGSRKSRKLPPEAMVAEFVVGTLELDWVAGPPPAEEAVAAIEQALAGTAAIVSVQQIDRIRLRRGELVARWRELEPGQVLELRFPG
jgi:hypothetical protein